ncbi:hypothetical protein B0H16DRAFT_1861503 [Mycena metata]|uniref:Uncharacterized protein n=1 Tax=Mycena metata TaxID=1033252 RepID=A0AAD7N1X7_9AGAR|nr:hypothetical protein B0H16DRAFT_1861503 [Mycena metata]
MRVAVGVKDGTATVTATRDCFGIKVPLASRNASNGARWKTREKRVSPPKAHTSSRVRLKRQAYGTVRGTAKRIQKKLVTRLPAAIALAPINGFEQAALAFENASARALEADTVDGGSEFGLTNDHTPPKTKTRAPSLICASEMRRVKTKMGEGEASASASKARSHKRGGLQRDARHAHPELAPGLGGRGEVAVDVVQAEDDDRMGDLKNRGEGKGGSEKLREERGGAAAAHARKPPPTPTRNERLQAKAPQTQTAPPKTGGGVASTPAHRKEPGFRTKSRKGANVQQQLVAPHHPTHPRDQKQARIAKAPGVRRHDQDKGIKAASSRDSSTAPSQTRAAHERPQEEDVCVKYGSSSPLPQPIKPGRNQVNTHLGRLEWLLRKTQERRGRRGLQGAGGRPSTFLRILLLPHIPGVSYFCTRTRPSRGTTRRSSGRGIRARRRRRCKPQIAEVFSATSAALSRLPRVKEGVGGARMRSMRWILCFRGFCGGEVDVENVEAGARAEEEVEDEGKVVEVEDSARVVDEDNGRVKTDVSCGGSLQTHNGHVTSIQIRRKKQKNCIVNARDGATGWRRCAATSSEGVPEGEMDIEGSKKTDGVVCSQDDFEPVPS